MEYNRDEIKKELENLNEGYSYFIDDIMETLEWGILTDEKIFDKKLINYVKSKGVIVRDDTISIEEDIERELNRG